MVKERCQEPGGLSASRQALHPSGGIVPRIDNKAIDPVLGRGVIVGAERIIGLHAFFVVEFRERAAERVLAPR